MSRDGALARARALRDELVKRGVPVSIEIQQGRPGTPNGGWFDTRFIGSMGHHIVSRRTQGLTPGLALVKRGRTDVPGPLCNGYLGFDGVARIICMGWANHPGAGGPYTLPGGTIPKDAARPYLFGWEIEGGITETDWPASFRIVMGKCHAATLAWLRRDERSHIEHKTWAPTRKIDRLNYTLTGARVELKPFLTVSNEEDDMFTDDDRAMLKELRSVVTSNSDTKVQRQDADGTAGMRYALQEVWKDTHALTDPKIVPADWVKKLMSAMARVDAGVAALIVRDPVDIDEVATAQAIVALLPQLDTAQLLAAIQALPNATVAAIKEAL